MSNPLAMDFPALAYFCLQAPKDFLAALWESIFFGSLKTKETVFAGIS